MDSLTLSLPTMWADHHILAVRDTLGKVPGVQQVVASALYRDVRVQYDPAATSADALIGILAQVGYPVGKELDLAPFPKRTDDSSDWFQFQDRITVTDRRDLEASGDFRKY
jgi:copper chaperone CopZ